MYFRGIAKLVLTLSLLVGTDLWAQTQSLTTSPTSTTVTVDPEEKPYKPVGKLIFQVFGRQVDDSLSKSSQGTTVIKPDVTVKYGNYITLGLDLAGVFGSGNASNFWNDDGKAPNAIVLYEAYAKINLHKNIFIKAGAVRTPLNPLMSIMTPGAFMGAHEEWQIGSDDSNITVAAFQAIPNSGTVSRRVFDDGSQAYFLSQTVSGKLKLLTGTELKAAATRFQFENLSTNVATDSYYLGNSLTAFEGIGKSVRFKHGFMGTESTVTAKQEFGPHEVWAFGSVIVNDQAPEGKNKGNMAGANVKASFGNYSVKPSYNRFDYQADVIPNVYTTLIQRYQNRTGYQIGLDLEMKKEKLFLKSTYVKMDTKDFNPYLADREVYNIVVEAKYDIF